MYRWNTSPEVAKAGHLGGCQASCYFYVNYARIPNPQSADRYWSAAGWELGQTISEAPFACAKLSLPLLSRLLLLPVCRAGTFGPVDLKKMIVIRRKRTSH